MKALLAFVKALLAFVLMAVMGFLFYTDGQPMALLEKKNSYKFPGQATTIPVNAMVELDFLKKHEVLDIRRKMVWQQPQLIGGSYLPSEQIFGQIEDGKPWWGIEGIYFYGNGMKSIEGPSEESRFLANPFLLVGLCEPHAYNFTGSPFSPDPFPPQLLELTWKPEQHVVTRYEVTRFFQGQRRFRCSDAGSGKLDLVAFNARDFGLNWLAVTESESKNVKWLSSNGKPALIRQFIHCGGSCGYPGGGNNMSPYQAELEIQVSKLPAQAVIKLWATEPAHAGAKADVQVTLDMQ